MGPAGQPARTALLASLLCAGTALGGCDDPLRGDQLRDDPLRGDQLRGERVSRERVSRDPGVQLRFEVAKQVLADIQRRKLLGQEVHGDCKMARALFFRELRRLDAPAAQRVGRRLLEACADAARTVDRRSSDRGG